MPSWFPELSGRIVEMKFYWHINTINTVDKPWDAVRFTGRRTGDRCWVGAYVVVLTCRAADYRTHALLHWIHERGGGATPRIYIQTTMTSVALYIGVVTDVRFAVPDLSACSAVWRCLTTSVRWRASVRPAEALASRGPRRCQRRPPAVWGGAAVGCGWSCETGGQTRCLCWSSSLADGLLSAPWSGCWLELWNQFASLMSRMRTQLQKIQLGTHGVTKNQQT